jgi:hypothetical protein
MMNILRNIRHIQVKKVAYHPNLFKAIITFERFNIQYDESDEIETIKLQELERISKVAEARKEC